MNTNKNIGNNKGQLFTAIGATLICAALCPGLATANDGTPPWIQSLVQKGQDVEITLAIISDGEPGIKDAYRVERTSGDEKATVLKEQIFSAEEADGLGDARCRWDSVYTIPDDCNRDPASCRDCDGDDQPDCFVSDSPLYTGSDNDQERPLDFDCDHDGTADCYDFFYYSKDDCDGDGVTDCEGWCEKAYHFVVTDACVPPGETEYHLIARDAHSGDTEWYEVYTDDAYEITVTDSGEACEAQSTDDGGALAAESDDDSKAESATVNGCSVAGPGAASGPLAFFAMLGIGLLAFCTGRRRGN